MRATCRALLERPRGRKRCGAGPDYAAHVAPILLSLFRHGRAVLAMRSRSPSLQLRDPRRLQHIEILIGRRFGFQLDDHVVERPCILIGAINEITAAPAGVASDACRGLRCRLRHAENIVRGLGTKKLQLSLQALATWPPRSPSLRIVANSRLNLPMSPFCYATGRRWLREK